MVTGVPEVRSLFLGLTEWLDRTSVPLVRMQRLRETTVSTDSSFPRPGRTHLYGHFLDSRTLLLAYFKEPKRHMNLS